MLTLYITYKIVITNNVLFSICILLILFRNSLNNHHISQQTVNYWCTSLQHEADRSWKCSIFASWMQFKQQSLESLEWACNCNWCAPTIYSLASLLSADLKYIRKSQSKPFRIDWRLSGKKTPMTISVSKSFIQSCAEIVHRCLAALPKWAISIKTARITQALLNSW